MKSLPPIEPIGHVRSAYKQKFGVPRQPGLVRGARAFLEILPRVQPELSLDGLKEFSHIWAIFYFHRNDNARFHAKVRPPRLRGKTVGIFATRSPHRPNPIGLSLLEIESVEANGIWVRGADLLDETPILDIKPYLREIESRPDARSGWSEELSARQVAIEWSPQAQLALQEARPTQTDISDLKDMIEDTVALDPRPLVYQGPTGGESHYRDSHVVMVDGLDVHFSFQNHEQLVILKLTAAAAL